MKMIKFRCKTCSKKIGVPVDYAGRIIKCPQCKATNIVPEFDAVVEPPSMLSIKTKEAPSDDIGPLNDIHKDKQETSETSEQYRIIEPKKICPYCGEEVLEAAKKCKHCREYFNTNKVSVTYQPKPIANKKPDNNSSSNTYRSRYKIRLLWAVIIFIILSGLCFSFWQYSLYQDRKSVLDFAGEVENLFLSNNNEAMTKYMELLDLVGSESIQDPQLKICLDRLSQLSFDLLLNHYMTKHNNARQLVDTGRISEAIVIYNEIRSSPGFPESPNHKVAQLFQDIIIDYRTAINIANKYNELSSLYSKACMFQHKQEFISALKICKNILKEIDRHKTINVCFESIKINTIDIINKINDQKEREAYESLYSSFSPEMNVFIDEMSKIDSIMSNLCNGIDNGLSFNDLSDYCADINSLIEKVKLLIKNKPILTTSKDARLLYGKCMSVITELKKTQSTWNRMNRTTSSRSSQILRQEVRKSLATVSQKRGEFSDSLDVVLTPNGYK